MTEPSVFAQCVTCNVGAIYVPEVGPMGDEFCATIEEAIAFDRSTGRRWKWVDGEPMCPNCVDLGEEKRFEAEGLALR